MLNLHSLALPHRLEGRDCCCRIAATRSLCLYTLISCGCGTASKPEVAEQALPVTHRDVAWQEDVSEGVVHIWAAGFAPWGIEATHRYPKPVNSPAQAIIHQTDPTLRRCALSTARLCVSEQLIGDQPKVSPVEYEPAWAPPETAIGQIGRGCGNATALLIDEVLATRLPTKRMEGIAQLRENMEAQYGNCENTRGDTIASPFSQQRMVSPNGLRVTVYAPRTMESDTGLNVVIESDVSIDGRHAPGLGIWHGSDLDFRLWEMGRSVAILCAWRRYTDEQKDRAGRAYLLDTAESVRWAFLGIANIATLGPTFEYPGDKGEYTNESAIEWADYILRVSSAFGWWQCG